VLSNFYSKLGQSKKLHLSGRPKHQIGILGTSKVYLLRNMQFIFTPIVRTNKYINGFYETKIN